MEEAPHQILGFYMENILGTTHNERETGDNDQPISTASCTSTECEKEEHPVIGCLPVADSDKLAFKK